MAAPNINKPIPLADDPNLVLPPAVRAAAARADVLHAQLRDVPEEQAEQVKTSAEPTPAPQPDGVQATEVQVQEPTLAPPPPTPPAEQDDGNWEQKYRASQGRLKQANDTVRELTTLVHQKDMLLAAIQTPPAPTTIELPAEFRLSPEDEENYGEDMIRVISAKAAQIAKVQVTELEQRFAARLAQIEGGLAHVGTTVTQDAREKFKMALTSELPNWDAINHDQNFHNWLGLTDPYSGGIRLDMLKKAYAEGNVHRTLAFFKGFLQEEAATSPAAPELTPGTTVVPKVSLQSLAAPGKAKMVSSDQAPVEKPIITPADITKFYADATAGKYKGRDAEYKAMETKIFVAQAEGRIR